MPELQVTTAQVHTGTLFKTISIQVNNQHNCQNQSKLIKHPLCVPLCGLQTISRYCLYFCFLFFFSTFVKCIFLFSVRQQDIQKVSRIPGALRLKVEDPTRHSPVELYRSSLLPLTDRLPNSLAYLKQISCTKNHNHSV